MGIVGTHSLRNVDGANASASASAVNLAVTRYHIEQARRSHRRKKARDAAPKRAASRRRNFDAAFEAALTIKDSEARKEELLRLEQKAEKGRKAAADARSERDQVRRRMTIGFENVRHVEVGGRMRAPFREAGLRSDGLGRAGKLFVRGCHRARFLRSANEKAFICVQSRRKVLNLDYAWVEGNRQMVSMIRIDLDHCFMSFDELRQRLRELVERGELPCMPHLVVGDVAEMSRLTADGEIVTGDMLIRPHLWFLLPDAVNLGSNGRKRPQRLLDAVYRGLVRVLLPLGADPNAQLLLVRGKNPLSPWWQSACFNDESYPSLSGYAAVLGDAMKSSREHLARAAAEQQSGLSPKASNEFFTAAAAEAWRILREWHTRRNPAYLAALKDREALYALLAAAMPMEQVLLLGDGLVEPQRGAYVLDKVIGYAASRWDPEKADAADTCRSRGKLRHLTEQVSSVREKQAIAGKASAEAKQDAARRKIMAAMYSVVKSGSDFTRSEIARTAGMSRKTVGKHWLFCQRAWVNRCLDKKGGLNPGPSDMCDSAAVADGSSDAGVTEGHDEVRIDESVMVQVQDTGHEPEAVDGGHATVAVDAVPAVGDECFQSPNETDSGHRMQASSHPATAVPVPESYWWLPDEDELDLIDEQARFLESDGDSDWQSDPDEPEGLVEWSSVTGWPHTDSPPPV